MHRRPLRVALALIASLVVATLTWNPVLGGSTRVVFFGSPGTSSTLPNSTNTPGVLLQVAGTSVTAGGATAVDVILANQSSSQLTHVVIQGGDAADPNALANPSFPAPPPICTTTGGVTSCIGSLPANTTYAAVPIVDTSFSTVLPDCSSSTATSLTCTVPNMSTTDKVKIRIILQPPAVVTPQGQDLQFWLDTSLKEGTSSTGSNQDTFFAYGHFPVLAATCSQVSTFFPSGQAVGLSNANTCTQVTNVTSNGVFSQGAFELVGASEVAAGTFCTPGISSCGFGGISQANVNFGVQPTGSFVTWDIMWTGVDLPTSKPKGVTHFAADGTVIKTIYFKPAQQCVTATQSDCWVTTNSTKTSFEAVFRTPNNGSVRGF